MFLLTSIFECMGSVNFNIDKSITLLLIIITALLIAIFAHIANMDDNKYLITIATSISSLIISKNGTKFMFRLPFLNFMNKKDKKNTRNRK